ncbi:MAG TPA: tetratricopeptide repeat protein [Candidatus Omnitrophota bacterium]|nr:tetratricopeptide repeat protein [Candidatus Omnitrophota bacterium]
MNIKKVVYVISILLLSQALASAGELTQPEGLNYYNEGVRAQKAGGAEMAMNAYQKAMVIGLDVALYRKFIYNNVAVIYAEQGDLEKAESMFLEALRLDPFYRQANFNLGILYLRQGFCQKAAEYLTKTLNGAGNYTIEEEHHPEPK